MEKRHRKAKEYVWKIKQLKLSYLSYHTFIPYYSLLAPPII